MKRCRRVWLCACVAALALGGCARRAPESRHFGLRPLADGVWAAIASDEGHAISNAGIVDVGDQTVVFDAFMTREAASDLARAAETLTGRAPAWLVYSHGHDDHVRGGPAVGAQHVIATPKINAAVRRDEETFATANADVAARLAGWKRDYDRAPVGAKREAGFWVAYGEAIVSSMRDYRARPADTTFEGARELGGSKRRARLIELRGHTDSDLIMYLPDDGIVFTGDLLFVGRHPYLGDGDVHVLQRSLDALSALGAGTYVPGHGDIGRTEDIVALRKYVDVVRERARSPDGEQAGPPPPYSSWGFTRFYAANLRALSGR